MESSSAGGWDLPDSPGKVHKFTQETEFATKNHVGYDLDLSPVEVVIQDGIVGSPVEEKTVCTEVD